MQPLRQGLIGLTAAAALVALASGTASATPVDITWDPNGASPSLSSATNFTFNNTDLSDFASITISPTGAFTESGILNITTFLEGGSIVTQPQTNGYQIYAAFTATGQETSPTTGSFTTLTYTLFGDVGGKATFSPPTTSTSTAGAVNTNGDTQVTLATGSLFNDANNKVDENAPSASADVTFVPAAGESGFFINPPSTGYTNLLLQESNTNTSAVVSTSTCGTSTCITINGGGGNADFIAVPEPASLLLLGFGLLGVCGVGWYRRRRDNLASA